MSSRRIPRSEAVKLAVDHLGPTSHERYLRTLGERLRQARRRSGMSGVRLAAAITMHHSRLCRIELGQVEIRGEELHALLDVLDADPGERVACERLMQMIVQPASFHAAVGSDLVAFHREMAQVLDAGWSTVRCCEVSLVPVLLQTLPYMEALFGEGAGMGQKEREMGRSGHREAIDELIRLRLGLQGKLFGKGPSLRFLLMESVFHFGPISGAEMAAQCHHVAQMARLDGIEVSIVPLDSAVPPVTSPFYVFDDHLASFDTEVGVLRSSSGLIVTALADRFDLLWAHALQGEAAIEHMYRLSEGMQHAAAVDLRG